MKRAYLIMTVSALMTCTQREQSTNDSTASVSTKDVAIDLLKFVSMTDTPVFKGTGMDTWDQKIRERGYILREDGVYHLWYTGFREGSDPEMHLGYATSNDGITWSRDENNPIYDSGWVEDMMVVKSSDVYYMVAEGRNDIAHMLTSTDRIHWAERGALDIRYVNGQPLSEGPYGTPTLWHENNIWYLFYERGDLGIWLATSTDLTTWTNVQDEPVIHMGPESYDKYGVAVNQIIKHNSKYYAYYHATAFEDWHEWSSCAAISDDLIHWKKYEKNPIMGSNKSSPILVSDGERYLLYTMHPAVEVHEPAP